MPHPNLQDVQIGRPVFLFFMAAVRQRGAAFFARIGGLFFIVRGGFLVIRCAFRPGGAFFFIFVGNVVNGKVRFRPGRARVLRGGDASGARAGRPGAFGARAGVYIGDKCRPRRRMRETFGAQGRGRVARSRGSRQRRRGFDSSPCFTPAAIGRDRRGDLAHGNGSARRHRRRAGSRVKKYRRSIRCGGLSLCFPLARGAHCAIRS